MSAELEAVAQVRDLLVESNRLLGELIEAVTQPPRLMWNQTETAARLGVSVRLLQQARARGVLVESQLFPGKVLFSEGYLARRIEQTDSDAVETILRGVS